MDNLMAYVHWCEMTNMIQGPVSPLSSPLSKMFPHFFRCILPAAVCLNGREKSSIVSMVNISGSDEETIPLCRAVKATGNIEDWLGALEKGMQVSYYGGQ